MNKILLKNIIKIWVVFILNISTFSLFAQVISGEEAEKLFSKGNYIDAAKMYQTLLKSDPGNIQYNINTGICYLDGHLVHSEALPYFQNAAKAGIDDEEFLYLYALAYQHAMHFDEALKKFEEYKSKPRADITLADKHINECKTGKMLMSNRVDVTFKNMGENINSKFADYYPFVSKSNDLLIYTARTNRSMGGYQADDGYYSSDILYSEKLNGSFNKSKSVGPLINSAYDDQCVGLSDDGSKLFIYSDKDKNGGDIYVAEKTLKSFKKPEIIEGGVNTIDLESSASLSEDGNTLFFVSNKPGGKGGLDLYMTRKLPTGEWAEAQNISAINTTYNEDFPTLSADGKTLYFCSQGHTNMGGYDIFKSEWNDETNSWSKPENIGYPINTPADERVISFTDGHHAYISAIKHGGFGDYDIYEVSFNEQKPKLLIKIKINDNESSEVNEAIVFIYDEFNELLAESKANPKNGEYLLILSEGNYNIEIDSPDHIYYTNKIIITEDMVSQGLLMKTITIEK